ncbi:beta-ketoacyl-[acyl-carrier-protein] synthase family protein [Thiorhodococcus mannitoliphagus]|uniref:Beta-ketoacyl-[acyl-carrier-protein] synthase family protein n=1 Tax=Thiorhodococcus mannitoliphagus TaxID=329406 RepID=A0A6P1DQ45_9GAMM|nr:beta-ketoacyl-[acyl-carrier-protein] synthase family protein [Thiorhodococcus mannitoliphagus]NEX20397.1 beta-ketoacyl-[acyl-carrier-protein] synthase family protein [Thiorhodococcus mannitoliphagus]
MNRIAVTKYTLTTCLGRGVAAHRDALVAGRCGLAPCRFEDVDLETWVGEVEGLDAPNPSPDRRAHTCRNNRLAELALGQDGFLDAARQAVGRYGASRVAVYLGTSTSGILDTELAYRVRDAASGGLPAWFDYRSSHSISSLAEHVGRLVGATGPLGVISTACSSSAKAFATAARQIACGLIDAAVVGGVDTLCLTTLYGFNSLELLARGPCRPFDRERAGLSIGEAAGYALLERAARTDLWLTGYGESSDAHHMSTPHPEGRGALQAMDAALARAGLQASAIDYINLHGTATPSNDTAEGRAVAQRFGARVPASSTKGATGHTLGAAGGVEAVICLIALHEGLIPGCVGMTEADPSIQIGLDALARPAPLRNVLNNSLGFGGTNCSLVFSREDEVSAHG